MLTTATTTLIPQSKKQTRPLSFHSSALSEFRRIATMARKRKQSSSKKKKKQVLTKESENGDTTTSKHSATTNGTANLKKRIFETISSFIDNEDSDYDDDNNNSSSQEDNNNNNNNESQEPDESPSEGDGDVNDNDSKQNGHSNFKDYLLNQTVNRPKRKSRRKDGLPTRSPCRTDPVEEWLSASYRAFPHLFAIAESDNNPATRTSATS
eukprot:GEZU01008778.1.p1 GENE.GEZU01008778.1~~GEZU01008778.1.p1  ORF type:complete len:210 (-),score=46.78 GEZU01008778.1:294-923(-)